MLSLHQTHFLYVILVMSERKLYNMIFVNIALSSENNRQLVHFWTSLANTYQHAINQRSKKSRSKNKKLKVSSFKDTLIVLLAKTTHPSSPLINSPDSIAHIKDLTYLSDNGIIRICLGGAM